MHRSKSFMRKIVWWKDRKNRGYSPLEQEEVL